MYLIFILMFLKYFMYVIVKTYYMNYQLIKFEVLKKIYQFTSLTLHKFLQIYYRVKIN